jgi:glycosyltransferase 2 family protein
MNPDEERIWMEQEDEQTRSVIRSFKSSRIWAPIILGFGVLGYLLFKNFDATALKSIQWNAWSAFWLLMAIIILLIRHLAYTLRLWYLAGGIISFWKCVKLIVIWEFCSAVSPSSLGGSAVSVFVLSNEKLGAPKTLAAIIYTVVLDSLFFILFIPLLTIILGVNVLYPTYTSWADFNEIGYSLLLFYLFVLLYGAFFFYGLFKDPIQFKRILNFFTKLPILKRWNKAANELGNDMILSARELAQKDFPFHAKMFGFTAIAWGGRFLLVNCLIIALIDPISLHPWDQLMIYGRQVVMFVFMMFSPTPGAAGLAELFFGTYIADYVPKGAGYLIAFIWRLLTYYAYLIAGILIIPTWLAGVIKRRTEERRNRIKSGNKS